MGGAAQKKEAEVSGLCSIGSGHQNGQLKTPTQTSRNQPKLPNLALRFHTTRKRARPPNYKQQRKIASQNTQKKQQNSQKPPKKMDITTPDTNRPIAGPPSGHDREGSAAIRQSGPAKKNGPPHLDRPKQYERPQSTTFLPSLGQGVCYWHGVGGF